MRGRKPKPTAKKVVEGNPGKRKLNKREPKPKMSADMQPATPPVGAGVIYKAAIEAECKAFADRYLPQLQTLSIITDLDLAAFELMSVHYAMAWAAASIIERDGLLLVDKFGQAHKHPALQVMRDNSTAFRAYAAEFGMSPSARARIQTPLPDDMTQLEMELFGPAVAKAAK